MKNLVGKLWIKLTNTIVNLIFPSSLYCICCGKILTDEKTLSLCDHCFKRLGWNHAKSCEENGLRLSYCLNYHIYSRTLIFDFKYRKKLNLLKYITVIMINKYLEDELDGQVLVPVPMHKSKLRKRGFNQALLMANEMSKALKLPVSDCLIRKRETRAMRGLGPEERLNNIFGAMDFNSLRISDVAGKRVVLIDDFFTTGATARACAQVLYESGKARDVSVLAFASKQDAQEIEEPFLER